MHRISARLAAGLHRRDADELIDLPGVAEAELLGNLRDLSRINALGAGTWLSRWALGQFVQTQHIRNRNRQSPAPEHIQMLDVGCGLGDIAQALVATVPNSAIRLSIIATDINPAIVRMAQAADQQHLVTYAAADGLLLPFADGSVEIVHCSFTLHHFAPAQAVALLGEMRRVATKGVIVNDVVRSWLGVAGAWLLGRLFRNRLTRHDGLASAFRAYTHSELRSLAAEAGLRICAARELPGYRLVLALE